MTRREPPTSSWRRWARLWPAWPRRRSPVRPPRRTGSATPILWKTVNPVAYPDSKCTGAGTGTHGTGTANAALDAACTAAAGLNGGTGSGNTGKALRRRVRDYMDGDPIRRTCDPKEQVCERGSNPAAAVGTPGDLGLVLPVEIPTNQSAAQDFPTQQCSTGKYALALPKPAGDPAALPNPPLPERWQPDLRCLLPALLPGQHGRYAALQLLLQGQQPAVPGPGLPRQRHDGRPRVQPDRQGRRLGQLRAWTASRFPRPPARSPRRSSRGTPPRRSSA